ALNSGAVGFLGKPLQSRDQVDQAIEHLRNFLLRTRKQVVLLMPDGAARNEVVGRLSAADVGVFAADDAEQACAILRGETIDCMVLHESAAELRPDEVQQALEQKAVTQLLPVVLYGSSNWDGGHWIQGHSAF